MFAVQQNNQIRDVTRETAVTDLEHYGMGSTANPQNTMALARLPDPKAKIRYLESDDIRIVALLPKSTDPRQLELRAFEIRGATRVSYLRPFGNVPAPSMNTRSFHAQPLKEEGHWLLEPTSHLPAGEYCFSPKFNSDDFCFGVDKK
jgi:hypothetical protein